MVLLLQRVVVVFGDIVVIPHKAFTPIETKRSWVFVNTTTVSSLCCCVCNNKGRTSRLFQRHIFRVLCPSPPSLPLFFLFLFSKSFVVVFITCFWSKKKKQKKGEIKKKRQKKRPPTPPFFSSLLSFFFDERRQKKTAEKRRLISHHHGPEQEF